MPVEEQIAILYCGTHGLLRDIPVDRVHDFEQMFLRILRDSHRADVLDPLRAGRLDASVTSAIESVAASIAFTDPAPAK